MRKTVIAFVAIAAVSIVVNAQELPAEMRASIDKAAADILAKNGVPSASVAVVRDGKIAYEHAYGLANVETKLPASPQMRYSIGSISKQFTSAALLMLAEEGKLSLDDKVIRWLPDLTRAGDVTIRQILSMTSGYQDFWPQDYVMPMMLQPVTAPEILTGWAKKPLDFEPGAKWQYSNTNYVVAGMIAEKVAGMPLLDFLQKRVFVPLHMTTVSNTDAAPLGPGDPMRYLRYALGPVRPAPKEGARLDVRRRRAGHDRARPGAVGHLDDRSDHPEAVVVSRRWRPRCELNNGVGSRYGLGVSIGIADGRRVISHGGEVSGFTARNEVYPDERRGHRRPDEHGRHRHARTDRRQHLEDDLRVDRSGDSEDDRPDAQDLRRAAKGTHRPLAVHVERECLLRRAGHQRFRREPRRPSARRRSSSQSGQSLRGGMTLRRYRIKFPTKTLRLTTFIMPDGKIEQYQIAAAE